MSNQISFPLPSPVDKPLVLASNYREQTRIRTRALRAQMTELLKQTPELAPVAQDFEEFIEDFFYDSTPYTCEAELEVEGQAFRLQLDNVRSASRVCASILFFGHGQWQWRIEHKLAAATFIYQFQGEAERWRAEQSNSSGSDFMFNFEEPVSQLLSFQEEFITKPSIEAPLYQNWTVRPHPEHQLRWAWYNDYYDGPISGYGHTRNKQFVRIQQIEEQEYSRKRLYSLQALSTFEKYRAYALHYSFVYELKLKKFPKLALFIQKCRKKYDFPKNYFSQHNKIGYYIY